MKTYLGKDPIAQVIAIIALAQKLLASLTLLATPFYAKYLPVTFTLYGAAIQSRSESEKEGRELYPLLLPLIRPAVTQLPSRVESFQTHHTHIILIYCCALALRHSSRHILTPSIVRCSSIEALSSDSMVVLNSGVSGSRSLRSRYWNSALYSGRCGM